MQGEKGAGPQADLESVIGRYRALSSCQVSDALGELGLPRAGLSGLHCADLAAKLFGFAFTVTCRPASESAAARIEYLGDIPVGSVVMIANDGRTDCSLWGGQRSLAARQRGARGTVVDGACRDIPEHLALGYPVFAKARTLVGSAGYANPVAVGEKVQMAGIHVAPGDIVIGDGSGVIVVPRSHAATVLAAAETAAARERQIADLVAAGHDFLKARELIFVNS